MRHVVRAALLLLMMFGLYAVIDAADPRAAEAQEDPACASNNDFACRSGVSLNTTVSGSNLDATIETDAGEIVSCGFGDQTVWWSFTPTEATGIQIDTFGSSFDTVLAVFEVPAGLDGVPSTSEQILCNDDAGGRQSRVRLSVSAGVEYAIQVANFSQFDGAGGSIELSVSEFEPFAFNVTSECVNGAATITLTIDNPNAQSAEIEFGVGGVFRFTTAEANATSTVSVSGRTDGSYLYRVFVLDDGTFVSGEIDVDCIENPPGPAAVVQVSCINESGVIRVNLVAGAETALYDVTVGNVFRSTFVDGGDEAVISITGRRDGSYEYTVDDFLGDFETSGVIASNACRIQSRTPRRSPCPAVASATRRASSPRK